MSDSLWPHGLQHARLLCPSLSPRVCLNSCPLSLWCPLLLPPSTFPSIRVFSNELALCIRWSNYRSFSFNISASKEYSWLISFRIDWFDLLVVQETLKESSPAPQFESINSSVLRFLYGPTLTFLHDYWKNYSFDYMDISHMSLLLNTLSRFLIEKLWQNSKKEWTTNTKLNQKQNKKIWVNEVLCSKVHGK